MLFTLLVGLADARDIPVPLDQVPAIIKAAVLQRFPGATLLACERDGVEWDLEVRTVDGERWEAEVRPNGRIRNVEPADDDDADDDKDGDDDEDGTTARGAAGLTGAPAPPPVPSPPASR